MRYFGKIIYVFSGICQLAKIALIIVLITFLAVIIRTWVFGSIGAFMVPLTVMVKKLILEPFPQTQLVAKLMGSADEDRA